MFKVDDDFSGTMGARGVFAIFGVWLIVTFCIFIPFFTFGLIIGLLKYNWSRLKGYAKDYLYFITGLYVFSIYYFGLFFLAEGYSLYFSFLSSFAISLPIKARLIKNAGFKENIIDYGSYYLVIFVFLVLFLAFFITNFNLWLVLEIILLLVYFAFLFRSVLFKKPSQQNKYIPF